MRTSIPSRLLLFMAASLVVGVRAQGQEKPKPDSLAQMLADQVSRAHPELNVIGFHLTPPGGQDNVIVASSNRTKVGKKSDPDDLEVMTTGKAAVDTKESRQLIDIGLPLLDRAGRTIGTVVMEVKFTYTKDPAVALKRATEIRDQLRKQIPSKERLFEPA
jgi:iron complex outermembrane receptor protein